MCWATYCLLHMCMRTHMHMYRLTHSHPPSPHSLTSSLPSLTHTLPLSHPPLPFPRSRTHPLTHSRTYYACGHKVGDVLLVSHVPQRYEVDALPRRREAKELERRSVRRVARDERSRVRPGARRVGHRSCSLGGPIKAAASTTWTWSWLQPLANGRAASGVDTGLAARLARAVPPRGTKTSLGRWSPASTSGPNMKASVALCSGW